MFKFTDGKITSEMSRAVVHSVEVDGDIEIDFAFSIVANNREYIFTESELQYMMDEVKSMKEGEE
tara:strand:- start:27 stop:221 length:195 start_codon:yes stop_codon:yes gene_type:complete